MTVRNVSLALGERAAAAVGCPSASLATRVRRIRTDNRLDRPEWLRTVDGRLLKTDAVDHHCGHDVIGCQDLAWDVAGTISEFHLDPRQAEELVTLTQHAAGRIVDPDLLSLYRLAYAAFRRGLLEMTQVSGVDDARRRSLSIVRYDAELQHLLAVGAARLGSNPR
jgi:hypothetical protein